MLLTSYSRAFWWCSNRAGINGLCINSSKLEKVHIPQRTFMARRKDKAHQAVFLTPTNPFWKWPRGRRASWWFHSSTESTLCYSLETWPRCSILDAIIKSAGSRIGIPANEVICNHDFGDCTDRVTSQNGDRVNFETLETPRPAPKVTLKKNWKSQQQQHSTSQKGRIGLEHKTLRTTPQKSTKKSARIHSHWPKLWKKKLQRRIQKRLKELKNWFEQDLCSLQHLKFSKHPLPCISLECKRSQATTELIRRSGMDGKMMWLTESPN